MTLNADPTAIMASLQQANDNNDNNGSSETSGSNGMQQKTVQNYMIEQEKEQLLAEIAKLVAAAKGGKGYAFFYITNVLMSKLQSISDDLSTGLITYANELQKVSQDLAKVEQDIKNFEDKYDKNNKKPVDKNDPTIKQFINDIKQLKADVNTLNTIPVDHEKLWSQGNYPQELMSVVNMLLNTGSLGDGASPPMGNIIPNSQPAANIGGNAPMANVIPNSQPLANLGDLDTSSLSYMMQQFQNGNTKPLVNFLNKCVNAHGDSKTTKGTKDIFYQWTDDGRSDGNGNQAQGIDPLNTSINDQIADNNDLLNKYGQIINTIYGVDQQTLQQMNDFQNAVQQNYGKAGN